MAPPRGTKRKSDEGLSATGHVDSAQEMATQRIASRPSTPTEGDGPLKKQKTGISMHQKQALIENLQLEITERARKLRAQYNLQAQGLRTRIEIRVNRIPMALRKAKMGELADRYKNGQQPTQFKPPPSAAFSVSHPAQPPPVPEKDTPLVRPDSLRSAASSRPRPGSPVKKTSDEISGLKTNNSGEPTDLEGPKTKNRAELAANKASKVLSPASANVRPLPRPTPGGKPPHIKATPLPENAPGPAKSPVKQSSTSNLFSSLAEKARSTRKDAGAKRGDMSASATASSTTGMSRGRKPGVTSATGTTKGASTAGAQRRISGISESSESSTATVVKKTTAKKGATAKGTGVLNSIRRGVAGAGVTKKAAATKAGPGSTATSRVLRKRN